MNNSNQLRYPIFSLSAAIVTLACSTSASAQTPLLRYSFNETGNTVANSGTLADADLTMRNQAGTALDRHTAGGGGISGLTTDRAFDNSSGFAYRASMSADIAGTDSLQQFTLTGWYYTAALGNNGARILDNASGSTGFYLSRSNTGFLELGVGSGGTLNLAQSSTTGFSVVGSWVFFAVTYDGAATSTNVRMYHGSLSSAATFDVTRSLNRGTPANDTAIFTVGNRADNQRQFVGLLDDIRLYSGVLDESQIEAVRLESIPPPPNVAPVVSAGDAQTITLPATASLNGSASDTDGPGALTTTWSLVSGPATVTFANPANPVTTATFSQPGTYTLRLSASDTITTTTADTVVTVLAGGFEGWIFTYGLSVSNAAPDADPDADGLKNLVEYGLNLNPTVTDSAAAISTALDSNGKLSLTFFRARSATELTYTVQASADLASWSDVIVNPGTVGQNVTVIDEPPVGSTRRFLRIVVATP